MSENRLRRIFLVAALCTICALPGPVRFPGITANAAWAAGLEDWKKEFDDICSKTPDSASLDSLELKRLIDRCDALRPRIEGLAESQKKVYLKRLQMCRDLFSFVLESKAGKQP